jgi:hypothetical protein
MLANEVGPGALTAAGSGWDLAAAEDLNDTHVARWRSQG